MDSQSTFIVKNSNGHYFLKNSAIVDYVCDKFKYGALIPVFMGAIKNI